MLSLFTVNNPKCEKGAVVGFLTFILHLAPSWLSGFNTCAMASVGCAAACLNKAGRGGMFAAGADTNTVQEARKRKTRMFFNAREYFMELLVADIQYAIRMADKLGMVPVFRLNGTSDIRWELVPCVVNGVEYANVMEAFPDCIFYDYTKLPNRRDIPPNYHLTFSRSESNDAHIATAVANGMNVAVVFENANFPATYMGMPVVDGDATDLRFLDPTGCIIGLSAKGPAKKDTSGFVVRAA